MLTEETSLQLDEGRGSFQTCVKLSYNITAGSSSYPAPDPSVPEVPQATFYYSCSDFPDFKKILWEQAAICTLHVIYYSKCNFNQLGTKAS